MAQHDGQSVLRSRFVNGHVDAVGLDHRGCWKINHRNLRSCGEVEFGEHLGAFGPEFRRIEAAHAFGFLRHRPEAQDAGDGGGIAPASRSDRRSCGRRARRRAGSRYRRASPARLRPRRSFERSARGSLACSPDRARALRGGWPVCPDAPWNRRTAAVLCASLLRNFVRAVARIGSFVQNVAQKMRMHNAGRTAAAVKRIGAHGRVADREEVQHLRLAVIQYCATRFSDCPWRRPGSPVPRAQDRSSARSRESPCRSHRKFPASRWPCASPVSISGTASVTEKWRLSAGNTPNLM